MPEGGEGRLLGGGFGLGGGKDAVELTLDPAAVFIEDRQKTGPIVEAHGPGQAQPAEVVGGQEVGLLIPPGLEAILHPTQEDIGGIELAHGEIR